ncbi:nuclear receptor coactivator 4-like [Glandiceps talaboti]
MSSIQDSQHQRLINEVKHTIAVLEDAIHQVVDTKRNLKTNGLEVKGQIHSCVSRQLEALRNREVWLLNQVETVQHAKEETLRHQLARLNQCLGSLKNCVTYAQQYTEGLHSDADPKGIERQLMENLSRFSDLNLNPEENASICFRADRTKLREQIHDFGRVDSRSVSVNQERAFTDPTFPSSSLPSPFEDYEDLDHHILYKTLEELKGQEQKQKACVRSTTEDWLMKAPTPTNSPVETVPNITFPPYHTSIKASQSPPGQKIQDVHKWLHHVPTGYHSNQSTTEDEFSLLGGTKTGSDLAVASTRMLDEDEEMEEKRFEMYPYFQQVAASPTTEWLLHADRMRATCLYGKDYPYSVMKYFREASNDVRDWLWKYEARQEDGDSKIEKSECKASVGCCTAGITLPRQVDIEDLDTLQCFSDGISQYSKDLQSEKEKWLASGRQDKNTRDKSDGLVLESMCIANEKCHHLSECVCDTHCMGSQFAQSEAVDNPLQKWYQTASNSSSDWLLKPKMSDSSSEEAKESAVLEYFHVIDASSASDWLLCAATTEKCQTLHSFSPMEEYLKSRPQSNTFWLAGCQSNDTSAMSVTSLKGITCTDKTSSELSPWLKPQCVYTLPPQDGNDDTFQSKPEFSEWLHKDNKAENAPEDKTESDFSEIFQHDDSEREKWLLIEQQPMDISEDMEILSIGGKTVEIDISENDTPYPGFQKSNDNSHMWLLNYTK